MALYVGLQRMCRTIWRPLMLGVDAFVLLCSCVLQRIPLLMSRVLKALLISAAATGAAALVLRQLDLDQPDPAPSDDMPFGSMDPDAMPDEDVELRMRELASQLGL